MKTKLLFSIASLFYGVLVYSQDNNIKLDMNKVSKFEKYMEFKHGGPQHYPTWKSNNKIQWTKEAWYYSESFYVKRNYKNEGIVLDESIIDISRFEKYRKENEESIVELPGFKDVIVLLPANKLIYKLQ
jgi:hypothetical protein